jgi:hypothetical protein
MKKSPVYLFYEIMANGSDGTPGDDRDVLYTTIVIMVCTRFVL